MYLNLEDSVVRAIVIRRYLLVPVYCMLCLEMKQGLDVGLKAVMGQIFDVGLTR